MPASDRIFKVEAEGLAELRRDLKKAGAEADDFKAANKAIGDTVARVAKREVPVKSGALRAAIRGEGTTRDAIIAAGNNSNVPYAGPIHFGWPTRGLGRSGDKQSLIRGLGSKGSRSFSDKALRKAYNQRHRSSNAKRGVVRGGPIPPNPFLYRALDQRIGEVYDIYDKRVSDIAEAVESGRI